MACQVVHGVQLRLIEGVHLQTLLLVEYLAQVVGKLVALALMSRLFAPTWLLCHGWVLTGIYF